MPLRLLAGPGLRGAAGRRGLRGAPGPGRARGGEPAGAVMRPRSGTWWHPEPGEGGRADSAGACPGRRLVIETTMRLRPVRRNVMNPGVHLVNAAILPVPLAPGDAERNTGPASGWCARWVASSAVQFAGDDRALYL